MNKFNSVSNVALYVILFITLILFAPPQGFSQAPNNAENDQLFSSYNLVFPQRNEVVLMLPAEGCNGFLSQILPRFEEEKFYEIKNSIKVLIIGASASEKTESEFYSRDITKRFISANKVERIYGERIFAPYAISVINGKSFASFPLSCSNVEQFIFRLPSYLMTAPISSVHITSK